MPEAWRSVLELFLRVSCGSVDRLISCQRRCDADSQEAICRIKPPLRISLFSEHEGGGAFPTGLQASRAAAESTKRTTPQPNSVDRCFSHTWTVVGSGPGSCGLLVFDTWAVVDHGSGPRGPLFFTCGPWSIVGPDPVDRCLFTCGPWWTVGPDPVDRWFFTRGPWWTVVPDPVDRRFFTRGPWWTVTFKEIF